MKTNHVPDLLQRRAYWQAQSRSAVLLESQAVALAFVAHYDRQLAHLG
jgi:hypothetical protein